MGQTDYNNAVLALSPTAYWKCNESSGTNEADASGNSRPATWGGTPTFGQTGLIYGESEKSTLLSGDDYCLSAQTSACSPGAGSFSVAFWMKRGATTNYEMLFTNYESGDYTNGFEIRIEATSSVLVVYWNMTSASQLNGTHAVDDNATHFVVLSYSSATGKATVYLDGNTEIAATSVAASTSFTPARSWIGKRNDGNAYSGYIEKLAYFQTALTSTNVSDLYTKGTNADVSTGMAIRWFD